MWLATAAAATHSRLGVSPVRHRDALAARLPHAAARAAPGSDPRAGARAGGAARGGRRPGRAVPHDGLNEPADMKYMYVSQAHRP
eukprot:COSAG02_NODE_439_length_22308_cov_18.013508_6_plen_85_part_00